MDTLVKEFCVCASIRLPDGKVINGHRHNNCINAASERQGVTRLDVLNAIQGFTTSTGRFVDRKEGMKIQRVSGRPSCYSKDGEYVGECLFSEDLY